MDSRAIYKNSDSVVLMEIDDIFVRNRNQNSMTKMTLRYVHAIFRVGEFGIAANSIKANLKMHVKKSHSDSQSI